MATEPKKIDDEGENDDVLTDAEREALEEDHGDAGEEDEDESEEGEGQGDGSAAKPDNPEPVDTNEPETPADPAQPEAPDESFKPIPVIKAKMPDDAEARLAEIKRQREAVIEQFDDGDINSREYAAKLEELSEKSEAIRFEVRKAEMAAEAAENQRTEAWERSVAEFMTTTGAKIAQSEAAFWAFDKIVRKVTGDEANARLSDKAKLEKAFAMFGEDMRKIGVDFAPAPRAPAKQNAPDAPKPKREVPPSLGKVPPAAPVEVDGSKFSALNRLADTDPIKFEEAFGRLSAADQAEYLST